MMNTQSKTADVLGGKTARACESCLRKRARWFCAADDAFLCQSCDTSVHSANQLASRHERVRLETSSWKAKGIKRDENSSSLWHQGFKKKPRTPRSRRLQQQEDSHEGKIRKFTSAAALVPEISCEETPDESEEREQLLYRVPVADDPFAVELCNETLEMDDITFKDPEFDGLDMLLNDREPDGMDIPGFGSTDIELQQLAVNVETWLGTETKAGWHSIEGLCESSIGCKGEGYWDSSCFEDKRLKVKEENKKVEAVMNCHYDPETGTGRSTVRESFNWDFDYSLSPIVVEEEEMRIGSESPTRNLEMKAQEKRRINLKLSYEAIISAWDCRSSPWTNGIKPDFNLDDCWPDFMGTGSGIDENTNGGGCGGKDEEREARVLRYREKRRTRLFAKKIRYEVRKLNADKRPRMKGRFVKRTSFAASSFT